VPSSHAVDTITFMTEDGVRLEAELRMPDQGPARGSAVICHPHPRHGGSKDHPILWAVRNELAANRGLGALVFNFRGVMGSSGTYGGGHDEVRDVDAAITRVREAVPAGPTVLCGWSFGANVALRHAQRDPRVDALVLIGIPLMPGDVSLPPLPPPGELRNVRQPTLLVAGDHDPFCPVDELTGFAASFRNAEAVVLEGTDHFLWRREKEAAERIGDFVDEVLGGPSSSD
jgi:alpha/beta superfamily hydrolase